MQSQKPGGTIYAIGAVGTSWVKIGCTAGPVMKRVQTLQTGQPFPLQVLASIPVETDAQRIEKQVHAFLAAERQRGEWFEVSIDTPALEQLVVRAVQFVAEQEEQKRLARLRKEEARRLRAPARNTIDMNALGKRLKLARVARDLTIQELSALSGVGLNQISRLENGDKPGVRVDTLAALAVPLEASLDHLVGLSGATSASSAPRLQKAPQETKPPAKRPRTRTAAPVG